MTRGEIETLAKSGNHLELEKRLLNRMEFGTAGLRSRMGAGYSMMNDLTIVQTSQGFFKYLESHFGIETLRQRGVVLGFDARHNSKRFAHLTARVFLTNNVRVYLFRQITPTPFVVRLISPSIRHRSRFNFQLNSRTQFSNSNAVRG